MKEKIQNVFKKVFTLRYGVPILVLLVIIFALTRGGSDTTPTVAATRGDVSQEVTVTGTTESPDSVALGFEEGGRVAYAGPAVGSRVTRGALLVALDTGELSAQLLSALARRDAQSARVSEVERGNRPEEVRIAKLDLNRAESAEREAAVFLEARMGEAYSESDNAIRNNVDQFYRYPTSRNPAIDVAVGDQTLRADANNGRRDMEILLLDWQSALSREKAVDSSRALDRIDRVVAFLDTVARAINNVRDRDSVESYRNDVAQARSSVAQARANLALAIEKWNSATGERERAEESLGLSVAGSSVESVAAERARLRLEEAEVARVRAQIAKRQITAPFAGILTKRDVAVGEIVTPGSVVAEMLSGEGLWVEAYIPEVHVLKLEQGNTVTVRFDAEPDREFTGRVASIEPAATLRNGVQAYKTVVTLDDSDAVARQGLSATLVISGERHTNVIRVPRASVFHLTGNDVVRVKEGESVIVKKVSLGLVGSDGFVEITKGLNVGEEVVLLGSQP